MKWLQTANAKPVRAANVPELDFHGFLSAIIESKDLRLAAFFGVPDSGDRIRLFCIMADDAAGKLFINSTLARRGSSFPSITNEIPAAHMFEREIFENFDIRPSGHPWIKPVRQNLDSYEFGRVKGAEIHEVAVGPVHAGVIEPGHFRFNCDGERINTLEIMHGYQHRGVEKMFLEGDIYSKRVLAESVAGDSAIANTWCYSSIIESLTNTKIEERDEFLRAIMLELERAAMHVGDMGAVAGDIAWISGADMFGAVRTLLINTSQSICGNRFGRGMITPGGCRFDVEHDDVDKIIKTMDKVSGDIDAIAGAMFKNPIVVSRLEKTGVVHKKDAEHFGIVGPAARSCGVDIDVRKNHSYGIYSSIAIDARTLKSGDVYARTRMRYLEAKDSLECIKMLLLSLPPRYEKVKCGQLMPDALCISLVEAWRGELMHFMITDEKGNPKYYKIKDPSFNNWSALELAVRENGISDFPVCNKSFNLSYCGFDL